jgi:uncharacterized MAPEG superfamily protein
MTFAYWCVLLAALIPIVWVGAAKTGADDFDNSQPRIFMANLKGWRQRANWAQFNAYEAFPPFAAGVIIAHLVGVNQILINTLAGIFIVARILHGIMYIRDLGYMRSLVWTAGLFCIIGLFLAAGWST